MPPEHGAPPGTAKVPARRWVALAHAQRAHEVRFLVRARRLRRRGDVLAITAYGGDHVQASGELAVVKPAMRGGQGVIVTSSPAASSNVAGLAWPDPPRSVQV